MLQVSNKKPKTKQDYSRNVKLLKIKIEKMQTQRQDLQKKLENAKRINNDRVIALKISKFCKQRKFTPQMLFRFADRDGTGEIDKVDWKNTLTSLGLSTVIGNTELTNDEMQKMGLLIDEDISGKVSIREYYEYLSAFNIRGESVGDQPFIVGGVDKFNKLLLQKTIGIKYEDIADRNTTQEERVGRRKKEGHKYITYEEFYKYCKKYFPELKDKQLISIFNRLDPDGTGLISVEELNILLKENNKRNQEILNKKNKNIIKKKQSIVRQNIPETLKDELSAVLYNRIHKGLFHLSQFKTIGIKLGNRVRMGQLFKDIDSNRVGSFDYDQIINFYLKRKSPIQNFNFVYQIMQLKMDDNNNKIEQLLYLNKLTEGTELTPKVLSDFLKSEFNIDERSSQLMHQQLMKEANTKRLQCRHLASKFREVARLSKALNIYKIDLDNIITLNYFGTKGPDFLRKGVGTIVKNPMVALKFCVQLQNQILRQNRQKWSDFEFGPIPHDPKGIMSVAGISDSTISKTLPTENELIWLRATDLGFTDFYSPVERPVYLQGVTKKSSLLSALSFLVQTDKQFLYRDTVPQPPNLQKLTNPQLQPEFTGLYPRIFHYFAKYGIYVFRFFIEDNWVYVLIDDLLPCTMNKQLVFSTSGTKKYSWIPLVEKAYAKIKGGYYKVLTDTTMFEAVYELSHNLSKEISLPSEKVKDQKVKDEKWKEISQLFPRQAPPLVHCINTDKVGTLQANGKESCLKGNQTLKIEYVVEVENVKSENYHRSHRLLLLRRPERFQDKSWNQNWSQQVPDCKFYDNDQQIKEQLRKLKEYKVLLTSSFVLNYSLFRKLFNYVFTFKNITAKDWQGSRALDKTDQKKDNYMFSEYRVRISQSTPVYITIYCIDQNKSRFQYSFNPAQAPQNWQESPRRLTTLSIPKLQQGNYLLTLKSNEPLNYSITVYLKTRSYKIKKVPGDADFDDIKDLEKLTFDEDSAGEKAMEYLNSKAFKVNVKRRVTCC